MEKDVDLGVNFFAKLALMVVMQVCRFNFPMLATVSSQRPGLSAGRTIDLAPVMIRYARTREYAVSHLPGASNLTTVEAIEKEGIVKDRPLVAVLHVGYRSAYLASRN